MERERSMGEDDMHDLLLIVGVPGTDIYAHHHCIRSRTLLIS